MFASVDLPAPEGPTIAIVWPDRNDEVDVVERGLAVRISVA